MVEKWHRYLNVSGHHSALLTHLFKTLDCINHQFLLTKLHVHFMGQIQILRAS